MDLYDHVFTYLHETWHLIGVKAFGENGEYASYTDVIVLMIIRKVRLHYHEKQAKPQKRSAPVNPWPATHATSRSRLL